VRRRARQELAVSPGRAARWTALAAYTALVYASLPYGPRIGRAVTATALGNWLLGPGMAVTLVVAAALLLARLVRRRVPWTAYAALACAAVGYGAALSWLRAQHLERVHLPEYGVAAWLAWWALAPALPPPASYAAAAALAAAIGWGDELVQAVTPGRFYDLRDVAANALGAALGILVLAALRSPDARAVSGVSTGRRSPRAAGS
jgi:hypothetical protein